MEHAARSIKFEPMGIGSILDGKSLRVPVNQREYKWEEAHVDDLLRDFNSVIGEQDYFLGTIVLSESEKQDDLRVADGQQRLATVSILLAAIRNYFLEMGEDESWRVATIEEKYLRQRDFDSGKLQPKLTMSNADHDYFLKRIIGKPGEFDLEPSRDSHRRISMAASKCKDHVASIVVNRSSDDAIKRLTAWVKWIRESALVIVVTVPPKFSVFKIFETLNDRGLDLSKADLIKNYLFDKAGDRIDECQQRWSSTEAVVESMAGKSAENLLLFIRHLFITQYGHTIEKELDDRVKAEIKSEQKAVDFCSLLAHHIQDYAAIHQPDSAKWNEHGMIVRKSIEAIRRHLQVEQITPLMLAVAMKFSVSEAKKAFQLFVNWSVRFLIVGGRGGKLDSKYADAAHNVGKGQVKKTDDLVNLLRATIPTDAEFQAAFTVARVPRPHIARYYLHVLERTAKGLQDGLVPDDDVDVLNLEHILPENPTSEWRIIPDMAKALYCRLGNMVLLRAADNTAAGNSTYSIKKPFLANSVIVTTTWAGLEHGWGESEITRRQKRLAEMAVTAWPISG